MNLKNPGANHSPKSSTGLHDCTVSLLNSSGKPYTTIFLETGIVPHWLSMFATGRIANPSVNRVQFLYEYLSGKKLIL